MKNSKNSKKSDDKFDWIVIGMLAGAALIIVMMCIIISAMPRQRNSTATKYDLECVAGRSRNPLIECKE